MSINSSLSWSEVSELINTFGSEEHIARRLKEWREAKGWSLEQLSKALKADPINHYMGASSLWKMENPGDKNGRRRPVNLGDALAIAKVFGKTLADIVLPENSLSDVRGLELVVAAMEALTKVEDAWMDYSNIIDEAQAYIERSSGLRERVEATHANVLAFALEEHEPGWERQRAERRKLGIPTDEDETIQQYVTEIAPTPTLAALEDVLADDPISSKGWAQGRRWGSPDERAFVDFLTAEMTPLPEGDETAN